MTASAAGCGGSLSVTDEFPSPLLAPMPLAAGLRLDEQFTGAVHRENLGAGSKWTIRFGRAQTVLFTRLFSSMFARLERLDGDDEVTTVPPVDLIIEAQVGQYAFTAPRDNGSDFYEVSIRYDLSLFLPDGTLADEWEIDAYGRSRYGLGLGNAEEAINDATVMALRDAAALLALGLGDRPKVKALLAEAGG